jgi:hypothetical protein
MLKFHHDLLATTVIVERLLQTEGDEEHCDSLADPPNRDCRCASTNDMVNDTMTHSLSIGSLLFTQAAEGRITSSLITRVSHACRIQGSLFCDMTSQCKAFEPHFPH